jgi:hypothetical protein
MKRGEKGVKDRNKKGENKAANGGEKSKHTSHGGQRPNLIHEVAHRIEARVSRARALLLQNHP